MKTLVKLVSGEKSETPYEKQMAEFRKSENWYAGKVVMSQIDICKQNYFTGAATPTMVSNWNLLRQSELETFNKIIYGKLPSMHSTNSSLIGNPTAATRSPKR